MKLLLMVLGLTLALTFGAITVVNGFSPARATATGDSADATCRDDGDDGSENPDLPDNPDEEDNGVDGHGEIGDTEDPYDPPNEWDDTCQRTTEPTGVLGQSVAPSATPCPTPGGVNTAGEECCPETTGAVPVDPCCNFPVGGDVGNEALNCCPFVDEGVVGAIPCCFSAGGPPHVDICSVSGADADCDGQVTAADAFSTLAELSGIGAAGTGCGSGGDADCSGAVDAADTLAILKVVAGVSEAVPC